MSTSITQTNVNSVTNAKAVETPQGEQKITLIFNGSPLEQTLPVTQTSVIFLDPDTKNLIAAPVESIGDNFIPILVITK